MKTRHLTRAALITALYVILTVNPVFSTFSYGMIQLRISEALTLLPFFMGYPAAVGLFLGVVISNIAGGLGMLDIVFGSLITLAAGIFTARARSLYTAGIYPVLFNAFGIGLILYLLLGNRPVDPFLTAEISPYLRIVLNYLAHVFFVGLGQFGAVYVLGVPLMKFLHNKVNLREM